jgi:hypothetical protein
MTNTETMASRESVSIAKRAVRDREELLRAGVERLLRPAPQDLFKELTTEAVAHGAGTYRKRISTLFGGRGGYDEELLKFVLTDTDYEGNSRSTDARMTSGRAVPASTMSSTCCLSEGSSWLLPPKPELLVGPVTPLRMM